MAVSAKARKGERNTSSEPKGAQGERGQQSRARPKFNTQDIANQWGASHAGREEAGDMLSWTDSLFCSHGPLGTYGLGHYGPGPYGPRWARALMGRALVGPLGPYGPGPYGPGPYGPPGPFMARALVGPLGPYVPGPYGPGPSWPPWALHLTSPDFT